MTEAKAKLDLACLTPGRSGFRQLLDNIGNPAAQSRGAWRCTPPTGASSSSSGPAPSYICQARGESANVAARSGGTIKALGEAGSFAVSLLLAATFIYAGYKVASGARAARTSVSAGV